MPEAVQPEKRLDEVTLHGNVCRCPQCGLELLEGTLICPNDGTLIDSEGGLPQRLRETYEFETPISTGGMGVVYKARHKLLGKPVAIKMLRPGHFNEATLMRFQREAKIASTLSHPGIVAIHDFGVTDFGQPFMIMEFLEGTSLSEKIKQKELELDEAIEITSQICDALAHAHEHGILHRDIKPGNIMLIKGGQVKVVDFGIAKSIDANSAEQFALTSTGEAVGSPLYMSPEQALGRKVDARSDLYSLGCMLFECLSGTPPFIGSSVLDTMMARLNQDAPTLRQATLGKEFPLHIESVVSRLLQRAPESRFQSANEVKQALKAPQESVRSVLRNKNAHAKETVSSAYSIVILITAAATVFFCWSLLQSAPETGSSGTSKATQDQSVSRPLQESSSFVGDFVDATDKVTSAKERIENCQSEFLDLAMTDVRDFELGLLKSKPHIKDVNLLNTNIGDGGLKRLAGSRIRLLNLTGTQITDDGLHCLYDLPDLTNLILKRADGVTDKGLPALYGLRNLRELELFGPHVSLAGSEKLNAKLRGCAVYSLVSTRYESNMQVSGTPAEKVTRIEKMLPGLEKLFPPFHRTLFKAYMNLGWSLSAQNKHSEARTAFLKAYQNASKRHELISQSDLSRAAIFVAVSSCYLKDDASASKYSAVALTKAYALDTDNFADLQALLSSASLDLGKRGLFYQQQLVDQWLKRVDSMRKS